MLDFRLEITELLWQRFLPHVLCAWFVNQKMVYSWNKDLGEFGQNAREISPELEATNLSALG